MNRRLSTDEQMMQRALKLAWRGRAWVAPNPMVGAVVVRDGEIVGEGYHRRFGGPHAEVNAINAAGDKAKGAALYVNLEPCSHYGKTPPCAELIVRSGISKVFVATVDPNPLVNGSGIERIRQAGIEVEVGLLEEQARELNSPYLKKAGMGRIWVTLKIAQTIDGRIASITGHSRWITSKESRKYAHLMRAVHDAVLVGSGTVKTDDPLLNVRHVRGRNPVRIVLDTNFSIPESCKLLNTPEVAPTWVFGAPKDGKMPPWADRPNVKVYLLERNSAGFVDLHGVLDILDHSDVMSMMVEGGSTVWTAFLDEGLVDKVEIVIAPIILGQGIDTIRDLGILKVHDAIRLEPFRWRKMGSDLHIVARVNAGETA